MTKQSGASSEAPSFVSGKSVKQACQVGNLTALRHWKTEGRLPNLMKKEDDWHFHEVAVKMKQLEVLRWLLTESGQLIDPSLSDAFAVWIAADEQEFAMLRVLLYDSGCFAKILSKPRIDWLENLPTAFRIEVEHAKAVNDFLQSKRLSASAREPYLQPEVCSLCYAAVSSQLVATVKELKLLLQRTADTTRQKECRI